MQFIITAVGPDRPGLVGELTSHLHSAGANLLETRMVNLRGQFAVMILLELAESSTQLEKSLPAFGKQIGLTLSIAEQKPLSSKSTGLRYSLKTYSLDQPGIVARLTSILRDHKVNIEELSARQQSAPFDGSPLFTTEMRLTVPATVPITKLRSELSTLCNQLNCDVDLEPVTD